MSLEQIQAVFRELVRSVPGDGRIVAATDIPVVSEIVSEASAPVEGYGFNPPVFRQLMSSLARTVEKTMAMLILFLMPRLPFCRSLRQRVQTRSRQIIPSTVKQELVPQRM